VDAGGGKAIDESTDAYDSIDWMIKGGVPNNNGRIARFGVSYPGWTTAMAMLDPHPALKAVSPQASPSDMFLGDDFHHNGAFRLAYGLEYAWLTESSKENADFKVDIYDTYEWYLKLGALSNAQNVFLKDKHLPTWDDFRAHPNYDAFWQRQAMKPYLTRVTMPTLNVAGWWDQEDFYGPVMIYRELEKHDTKANNFLVVGPWNHGGWRGGPGKTLGNIDFASNTGEYYRGRIEAPFFAHYLKDAPGGAPAEATVFESGSNTWRTFNAWPPKEATTRALYFGPNGTLSFTAPTAAAGANDHSAGADAVGSQGQGAAVDGHRPGCAAQGSRSACGQSAGRRGGATAVGVGARQGGGASARLGQRARSTQDCRYRGRIAIGVVEGVTAASQDPGAAGDAATRAANNHSAGADAVSSQGQGGAVDGHATAAKHRAACTGGQGACIGRGTAVVGVGARQHQLASANFGQPKPCAR
jgi:hypothetical protein